MGTVILFPRHRIGRPEHCTRHEHLSDRSCPVCDGGLSICVTCGGAEASIPSNCPQRPMTPEEQDDVAAGTLDFFNGRWLRADGSFAVETPR